MFLKYLLPGSIKIHCSEAFFAERLPATAIYKENVKLEFKILIIPLYYQHVAEASRKSNDILKYNIWDFGRSEGMGTNGHPDRIFKNTVGV